MTQLTAGDEVLYRQIHPNFYDNGKLLSIAFKPSSGDEGKMSLDRSSLTDPQAAHEHYTVQQKKQSACVFGVTVEEFAGDAILCHSDPIAGTETVKANEAHCLADYSSIDGKKWKDSASKMRDFAVKRGVCFTPELAT